LVASPEQYRDGDRVAFEMESERTAWPTPLTRDGGIEI
jgi:hypothetical protein